MTKEVKIAHLYGDLMNTYGDYGNILVLKYYGKQMGIKVVSKVVSIDDDFKASDYDLAILGDGQYFEQSIVAQNMKNKAAELKKFITTGKPLLAVGQGFQLLGRYYLTPDKKKIAGLGVMPHYSVQARKQNDLVGNITIEDPVNHQQYHGFSHHQDQTFLGAGEKPLGKIIKGEGGNNLKDNLEGAQYQNTYGTYIHSFLARNHGFAKNMLKLALNKKA